MSEKHTRTIHDMCIPSQTLALWVPPARAAVLQRADTTLPELLSRQATPLLDRLHRDLVERQCSPDIPSLTVALITLCSAGLSLAPADGEATILGFKGPNNTLTYTAVVQRGGWRRLVADQWPVREFKTHVVVEGDKWRHWFDDEGEHIYWEAGENRAPVVLKGALNFEGLLAVFTWIGMRDRDVPPILSVMDGSLLREKLKANRNVTGKGGSAWATHTEAMIEKTGEKAALSRLARTGRMAGLFSQTMTADGLSEARRLPELAQHLRDVGADRGLPPAATDVLDIDPGALALEHHEGDDDLDAIMQGGTT